MKPPLSCRCARCEEPMEIPSGSKVNANWRYRVLRGSPAYCSELCRQVSKREKISRALMGHPGHQPTPEGLARRIAANTGKCRPLAERFWEKVERSEGCWLWKGGTTGRTGYGRIMVRTGNQALAHRVAWEFTNGPIPNGLECLHRCDVPACVRPDHLFLGTHEENMQDASRKGRFDQTRAADLRSMIRKAIVALDSGDNGAAAQILREAVSRAGR